MNNFNLIEHLIRQIKFSKKSFGPGDRMNGVLDHISKEIKEVRDSEGDPSEWVDLLILSMDGMWRSISKEYPNLTDAGIALALISYLEDKQSKNEKRSWPDWRESDPNKAIEHVR